MVSKQSSLLRGQSETSPPDNKNILPVRILSTHVMSMDHQFYHLSDKVGNSTEPITGYNNAPRS